MAQRPARSSSRAKRPRHASVGTDGIRSVHRVAPDRWLHKEAPRGSRSGEKGYGELRAVRVPPRVISTLKGWVTSPEQVRPLARLIRDMLFANAYYHAQQKQARWAAGAARDPHYKQSPEDPGALGPLRRLVDEVIASLETLIDWPFPPIELKELDAKLRPTGRNMKLSRLDENRRRTFEIARQALLGIQRELHEATRRPRGRKARLVKPFRVAPFSLARGLPTLARRRELVRMLRDEIFALHPDRKTRQRAAKTQAGRLAHLTIGSIPLLAE